MRLIIKYLHILLKSMQEKRKGHSKRTECIIRRTENTNVYFNSCIGSFKYSAAELWHVYNNKRGLIQAACSSILNEIQKQNMSNKR